MNDSIETSESMARPWTRPAVSEGTASAQRVLGVSQAIVGYLWPSGRMDRGLPAGAAAVDEELARQCKPMVFADALHAVEAHRDTLMDALRAARMFIHTDRTSYADFAMREDGTMEDQDIEALRDFDETLQVIDDAIALATGGTQ